MNDFKWDDLRYLLAVARAGQMLGAARRLGVSQARVSRRIAALEAAIGARLLDRSTRGCTLTGRGQAVFDAAERIEAQWLNSVETADEGEVELSGTVRIGAPDGFGSAFLAPRLQGLRHLYPELRIQLVPLSRAVSLSQREADLAIMVGRPERGRLKIRRLTDYTLGLYASRRYLQQVGTPCSAEQLREHTLIGHVDDLIHTPQLQYTNEFLRDWQSDIEVATAIGQLEAVRSGGGVGVLHDFMAGAHPDLLRVLPELSTRRSYWIVWHENMSGNPRVLAVANFIDQQCSQAQSLFLP